MLCIVDCCREEFILYKQFLIYTICFFVITFEQAVFGCSVIPEAFNVSDEELVSRSALIALSKAQSITRLGSVVRVEFEMIELLKGELESSTFSLDFERLFSVNNNPYLNNDFDSHQSPAFWEGGASRSFTYTDCTLGSGFEIGQYYLIFDYPHLRAYEQVRLEGDGWLTLVRQLILHHSLRPRHNVTVKDYFSKMYGVVYQRCSEIRDIYRSIESIKVISGQQVDKLKGLTFISGSYQHCLENDNFFIAYFSSNSSDAIAFEVIGEYFDVSKIETKANLIDGKGKYPLHQFLEEMKAASALDSENR